MLNILRNSYGLVWISTTLVFLIASLGNCGTYLMQKRSIGNNPWSFDVSYINMAAGAVYGYALLVPMVFYFLLQYLGSNVSLVRFWCMWGYSLFIFILSSVSFNCTCFLVFFSLTSSILTLYWQGWIWLQALKLYGRAYSLHMLRHRMLLANRLQIFLSMWLSYVHVVRTS